MGDIEAGPPGQVESPLKYHPECFCCLTETGQPGPGPRVVGSLTGAVASQMVTEAPKGPLSLDGNQALRVQWHKGA